MFDLEQEIKNWRKKLEKHPGLEPGYIEELEGHFRDRINKLLVEGYSKEEAFHKSIKQFNDVEEIADEYHKARSRKNNKPTWKSSGWIPTMLPSYIKMAVRVIRKQKQFSVINTLGLSIGLACCLLIFLYIFQQLQYDQFHPESDKLYRITYEVTNKDSENHYAISVPGLSPTLQETYPEIEEAARVSAPEEKVVEIDGRLFNEQNYFHADSTFFGLFGFSLTQGNPQTALAGPNKVVLSHQTAEKYFANTNPIGKTVSVSYGEESIDLEVSGVAAPQTEPAHFEFDLLASFETLQEYYPIVNDQNWWMRSVYSYLKLADQQGAAGFQNHLSEVVENNMADLMERSGSTYAFHLQPMSNIHLYSHLQQEIRANGNILYVYLFGSIALLVLLIACFNYMNLATARYAQRATEVGVRKSLGASRWSLMKQFMGESLVFTLMAVLLSVLFAWIAHPALEQLTGQTIHLNSLNLTWIALGLPLIWLVTGIIAGSYPALFLSGFEPTQVLKGTMQNKTSGAALRKTLVVVQFSISVALIIGAGVVYQQLNYAENKPLGYEHDQVVAIPNSAALFSTAEPATIRHNLKGHPSVQEVAFASQYPTQILSNNTMIRPEGAPEDAQYNITQSIISPEYQRLLQLDMVDGRNFSHARATDTTAYIINEAAADYFGWKDPIGKKFYNIENGERLGEVIGVFKNYHVQSLYKQIEPVIYTLGSTANYDYTLVKLDDQNVSSTLQFLEGRWKNLDPSKPFEYAFLDSQYEAQYRSEKVLGKLVTTFSAFAILIACLGLFGLATFSAQRRTKEIGVRKVLGASVFSIIALLSQDFLRLMGIAFVVAVPVTWYAANRWLQNFAYHIEIGAGIFILAGLIVMAIALATVSWQSVKAAMMNPVKSLRSE